MNIIPVSELPEYVRMVKRVVDGGFKDEYGVRLQFPAHWSAMHLLLSPPDRAKGASG